MRLFITYVAVFAALAVAVPISQNSMPLPERSAAGEHVQETDMKRGGPLPPIYEEDVYKKRGGPLPPIYEEDVYKKRAGPLPPIYEEDEYKKRAGPLPPIYEEDVYKN